MCASSGRDGDVVGPPRGNALKLPTAPPPPPPRHGKRMKKKKRERGKKSEERRNESAQLLELQLDRKRSLQIPTLNGAFRECQERKLFRTGLTGAKLHCHPFLLSGFLLTGTPKEEPDSVIFFFSAVWFLDLVA